MKETEVEQQPKLKKRNIENMKIREEKKTIYIKFINIIISLFLLCAFHYHLSDLFRLFLVLLEEKS